MKKLAAVSISALMIALLVGVVAAPASAKYPPKKPTCQVSDSSISPGDQVTVSGKKWKPGSTVTFTLQPEGIPLGSTTVGGNGKFSHVVTIPKDIDPGAHTIVCSGIDPAGNRVSKVIPIQILAGVVGGGGAAFTGTVLNVPLWMVLIAALFAAGVVVVAIGRRRRRSVGTGS